LEYLFLFLGLIAVDSYIWISADAVMSQDYETWSFNLALKGLQGSLPSYVAAKIGAPWLAQPTLTPPKITSQDSGELEGFVPQPILPTHREPLRPLAVVGRIVVPRLNLEAMVREGVTESTLRRAVGHIPSTALPGEVGNVAFAGHRDTFFRALRGIQKSDVIEVETLTGTYSYRVDSLKIVSPKDISVLASHGKDQQLTLVTCYPFNYIGSAPRRFIVSARQISANLQPPRGS
jgi:LPXTG-site transpeptidase (sortase) family protein